jgi:thymidylate synthase
LEILSESTGEAWEKLSVALLDSRKRTKVNDIPVFEIRWLAIHVNRPLNEARISDKFNDFCGKIKLREEWKPRTYFLQVTGKVREGYWWNVYGKPIWEQMPNLERILKQNSSYNKPSIVLRDSMKHLGASNTPCLVYLTFLIRNGKLELGVHFDTNTVEYIQGNMYGLSEVQKIVAEKLRLKVGTYHHHCDSLFISEKHLHHLAETMGLGGPKPRI